MTNITINSYTQNGTLRFESETLEEISNLTMSISTVVLDLTNFTFFLLPDD